MLILQKEQESITIYEQNKLKKRVRGNERYREPGKVRAGAGSYSWKIPSDWRSESRCK